MTAGIDSLVLTGRRRYSWAVTGNDTPSGAEDTDWNAGKILVSSGHLTANRIPWVSARYIMHLL